MAEETSTPGNQKPAGPPPRKAPPPARSGKKKRGRRTWLVVTIVLVLVAVVVALIVGSLANRQEGTEVDVAVVSRRTIVQTVTATGVIDPLTQVTISPEVSGEIIALGAEEGERVSRGQLLVRISPASIEAQRDEAQAGISAARARQAQAEAQLLRTQQDLARVEQLFERKLATAQERDNARAQVNIARAEANAARYGVDQARASLRRVTESLGKTAIYAPISGVVTKLRSKVGEKVVGAIQMTGTEIMTIADLSVIESVVDVSETEVVQVSLGDTAEVEVDAIPGQRFLAVVSRIANSPKQSGLGTQEQVTNFEVRLRFLQPDERFRPGMTATATIRTATRGNVLAVPIQSVTTRIDSTDAEIEAAREEEESDVRNVAADRRDSRRELQPKVFVVSGDTVALRTVRTGIRDNTYIEIVDGLKPGERVVSGSYKAISRDLEEGERVAVDPPVGERAGKPAGGKR